MPGLHVVAVTCHKTVPDRKGELLKSNLAYPKGSSTTLPRASFEGKKR